MSTSVKGFLLQYRERSLFPARKHLVPDMNPHTGNAATKLKKKSVKTPFTSVSTETLNAPSYTDNLKVRGNGADSL